ncbi:hypothetical protein KKI24_08300 [bacterium]|nr:hypothetical protein [bacterium]
MITYPHVFGAPNNHCPQNFRHLKPGVDSPEHWAVQPARPASTRGGINPPRAGMNLNRDIGIDPASDFAMIPAANRWTHSG